MKAIGRFLWKCTISNILFHSYIYMYISNLQILEIWSRCHKMLTNPSLFFLYFLKFNPIWVPIFHSTLFSCFSKCFFTFFFCLVKEFLYVFFVKTKSFITYLSTQENNECHFCVIFLYHFQYSYQNWKILYFSNFKVIFTA